MSTDEKLDKLIELQLNSSKNSSESFKFNRSTFNTGLLTAGFLGIISAALFVWNNDKDQDNKMQNFEKALITIQENQVALGLKFDKFAEEPRYTKKQHDTEIQPLLNEVKDLHLDVEKNIESIKMLNEEQRTLNNKLQIFELKLNK